jgi:hypothetical protein
VIGLDSEQSKASITKAGAAIIVSPRLTSLRAWLSITETMEMDDDTKQLAEEVGAAINESVQQSPTVAAAIERLREAGFEMELTLKLEIGLRPHRDESDSESAGSLELTDEDMRVLQAMKIKIEPEE